MLLVLGAIGMLGGAACTAVARLRGRMAPLAADQRDPMSAAQMPWIELALVATLVALLLAYTPGAAQAERWGPLWGCGLVALTVGAACWAAPPEGEP